ncbi:MAG TPA: aldo/keto reductase [Abditibacteriaceae bacterium]|nr:aldo/keto reductase [Abditibacteriaceae bacterium]
MNTNNSVPTRVLGKTGFEVSLIGFGAWAIGGSWGEEVDEATALAALHAAADAGTNFIDTADVYGGGRSERLIGQFLKERSERIYVATKMGRNSGWDDSYASVERAAMSSLKNLDVETLDLVQLHCVSMETMRGPVWEHLETLKTKGLIRFYGASVESIEEGLHCIEYSNCATLQVIFNIFRQRLIDELFPAAQSANVGLIARVPLASGILTGKFGQNHKFAADDHRNFNSDGQSFNAGETFAGVPFERGVEFAEKIRSIVGDSAPLSAQALRWILDYQPISTVIPGAKTPGQAQQNAVAATLSPLSSEVHAALQQLYRVEIEPLVRGAY